MVQPPSWFKAPARRDVMVGKVMGAVMWFWIMVRLKEDGPVMFVFDALISRD